MTAIYSYACPQCNATCQTPAIECCNYCVLKFFTEDAEYDKTFQQLVLSALEMRESMLGMREKMNNKLIGAKITYRWDSGDLFNYEGYVSFGDYDEITETSLPDGTPDDLVFYYCSQKELEGQLNKSNGEWTLVSIDEYILSNGESVERDTNGL